MAASMLLTLLAIKLDKNVFNGKAVVRTEKSRAMGASAFAINLDSQTQNDSPRKLHIILIIISIA